MTGNMEQQAFDYLARRGAIELCEACEALPYDCDSVRNALNALRRKGPAHAVKIGQAVLYFLVPNAQRPEDRRGKRTHA